MKQLHPKDVEAQKRRNWLRSARTESGWKRARKVRDLYFTKGLTQQEIADRLEISQTTVSRIARGVAFPDSEDPENSAAPRGPARKEKAECQE